MVKDALRALDFGSSVKTILVFFLGLNIGWMETAFNSIRTANNPMMGWPPLNLWMPALHWYWIHMVLIILTTAVLIVYYERKLKKE